MEGKNMRKIFLTLGKVTCLRLVNDVFSYSDFRWNSPRSIRKNLKRVYELNKRVSGITTSSTGK